MFHSFQLRRLSNQSLWKEFEDLMEIYKQLTDDVLLDKDSGEEFKELHNKYENMNKNFVGHCIEITKIII